MSCVWFRDRHSPLHLSAAWGLEKTIQCLMEHDADINAKVNLYFSTVSFAKMLSLCLSVCPKRTTGIQKVCSLMEKTAAYDM